MAPSALKTGQKCRDLSEGNAGRPLPFITGLCEGGTFLCFGGSDQDNQLKS
jgi:hypothetical protein